MRLGRRGERAGTWCSANSLHVAEPVRDRDETFARACRGIHIYDSMVVFEKDTRRGEPFHTIVGATTLDS